MPANTSALTLSKDDSPPSAKMREWEALSQTAIVLTRQLYAMAKRRDGADLSSAIEEVRIVGTNLCVRYALTRAADDELTTTSADLLTRGLPAITPMQRKYRLTHAEARVTMLLAERKTNREIADTLDVTEHTARRHTEHVMKKLKVHRRGDVRRVLVAASHAPPRRRRSHSATR